ncbi:MAG: oxidoreductase [Actinomycetota bacterium]|nr:oxidoreductase [Actinomycetota bacterium]
MHMPWTAADMPDLHGRRAVVTGSNGGIGYFTALELSKHGAAVTLAVRDVAKGQSAATRMHASGASGLVVQELDLASQASVRRFADRWSQDNPSGLDLLINNAGVMAIPRKLSRDGFELQFATNYLGHFTLTALLMPALLAQPQARIVNVTSNAHRFARSIDFDDLQGERRYRRWTAYGQSKLAQLLFTNELQTRLDRLGSSAKAMAAHPGYAATALYVAPLHLGKFPFVTSAMTQVGSVIGQSAAMGALPSLYAATASDLHGDSCIGPNGAGQWKGNPQLVDRSAAAMDVNAAMRLWNVSEEITGIHFPLD